MMNVGTELWKLKEEDSGGNGGEVGSMLGPDFMEESRWALPKMESLDQVHGNVGEGERKGEEVLEQHMSVFFDPIKGLWKCRQCDWTYLLSSLCMNDQWEAPTDASLGATGSLLGKLDMLLAPPPGRGCRLPKGVMDGIRLLKDDVEEIRAYLEDMAEVEDPPLTSRCWMKEARELSYNIEDYIDRFVWPARANIKTTRFVCRVSHVKITRLPKRPKRHKQMAEIVSEFRIYAQEAIEQHERYQLGSCTTFRSRFVSVGPMLPTPYEEANDVVIDGRMNEFINSVADDMDQQLKVISVFGSGCLGKTTLAKVLFNKFGGQFDCRAFIRVSKKPDMKRLFCNILSQVQRQHPPGNSKDLDLVDNIRKHLQDKRYLIIIDDLWDVSVWDIINHAFPKSNRGSRIITTTQIEDVALTCCCYHPEHVFEMKPLDDDHSRKLFFNRLFGSESDCPEQFKEVSCKIVEICGGLPLATISVASLLASQPVISIDILMYIHDSLRPCLLSNSTSERTRQVLNLSYNNLPHRLKTCLLYLSMYSEGCTIRKEDLVKQWMAERFIHTTEWQDMKKIAGSYFDELIDRRFIQPVCINYNNEVLSCTVHDVVHHLIAYKSAEENFIEVIDYCRKNVALSYKVRRLSLLFGDAKYAKTPANIKKSQVRSLNFWGLFQCMPCITQFKIIRILNLQLYGHRGGNNTLDLTGISELFQLRYLKIVSDVCIELPNHMQGLQCLETLDMDTEVTAVPWDIIHLPRLLHLSLPPFETNLLHWIASIRPVSLWSLGKLNDLQDLHLTCSTLPTDHLERSMEALGSLVGGHQNLKTLALVPSTPMVRGAPRPIISWDGLAPPPLLQRFEWSLHSCIFSRVPKWIGKLGNLCILKIAVRKLLRNCVNILRGLPALTVMSLYVKTVPAKMIVFGKAGFSVLKYFKFRCSLPWLKFEAGAMPNLQKLKLGFNAPGQHAGACIIIDHLSGLKEISAKIGGACADAGSALTIGVSNHPSNPRISVQLVEEQQDEILLVEEQQDEILEEDPANEYRKRQTVTSDLKELLIACARAVEEEDRLAVDIMVQELRRMVSVSGEPLQRLGGYMMEGLVARLASSGHLIYKALKCKKPTGSENMSYDSYMHLLYEVCPYFKLGYMSANGAIAAAVYGEDRIHIIDFRISQGAQWLTVIHALAARPGGPPKSVRITGIDDSESAYSLELVGSRLSNVARSCGVPFEFHAVAVSADQLEEGHLGVIPGEEALAVNFTMELHCIPAHHRDRILRLVKSLSPKVVTLVEQESDTNTAPFLARFTETLDYYTAIFESIDVALPRDDKERISMEQHCLASGIVNIVACEGAERVERHELFSKWKERLIMAGFTPSPLSTVVNNTARTLLQSYSAKYHLDERDGVLYLGWNNRPLVVSSAWH